MTVNEEEFKKRLDESISKAQTVPLLKKPVQTELSKVPETRPEGWERPVLSEAEYSDALRAEKERLADELELEQLRKGSVPFWWNIKRYIIPTGIAAVALGLFAYVKGC
jgi:hypothetical protein